MSREKQVMPTNFLGLLICTLSFLIALHAMFRPDPTPTPSEPTEATHETTSPASEEKTHNPGPLTIPDLPVTGGPK